MSSAGFQVVDWVLVTAVALMWGSSFLAIKEALFCLHPGAVVFLRVAAGAMTLALAHLCFHCHDARGASRAYVDAVACAGWPRIARLGLFWAAAPLTVAAICQQWVGTGIAGMIFATPPVWGTLVNAALTGILPSRTQAAGLMLGLAGVLLILTPSMQRAHSASGISAATERRRVFALSSMLLSAVSVAYGSCLAAPLQRRATARAGHLGFLPSLVLMLSTATLYCLPYGAWGLAHSRCTALGSPNDISVDVGGWLVWALGAELALGCLSTGLAYL